MSPALCTSRSSMALAAAVLLGCQTIIGIADYEIEPTLGQGAGGDSAAGAGGEHLADAGERSPAGGPGGGAGEPGMAGSGGSFSGCRKDLDCDDTIPCTDDRCGLDGICQHLAKQELCVSTHGNCLRCELGLGCVQAPTELRELLRDGSFDLDEGAWLWEIEEHGEPIVAEPDAHSGGRAVRMGPSLASGVQAYADVSQRLVIPKNTQSLQLSGYYQVEPGPTKPGEDSVYGACFDVVDDDLVANFYDWSASGGEQNTWKAFSHSASRSDVLEMWETEYAFALVAYTTGSAFRFDSLSLQATVCE